MTDIALTAEFEFTPEQIEAIQKAADIICERINNMFDSIKKLWKSMVSIFKEFWDNLRPFLDLLYNWHIKWCAAPAKWKHYALYSKKRRVREKYVKIIYET